MAGLFKVDQPDTKTPPSKDDENARRRAVDAAKPRGGQVQSFLGGLAAPNTATGGRPAASYLGSIGARA